MAESKSFDKALLGSKLWIDDVRVVVGCEAVDWLFIVVVESLSDIVTIDGSTNKGLELEADICYAGWVDGCY
jgi:hypothetical protein